MPDTSVKTILLVDDDRNIRFIFSQALRQQGYRVIEAASGAAGFEVAQQELPDLILTDITMPDGDGEGLLRQIRDNPELCTKQVVLMTGNTNKTTSRKGMEEGADDFLIKPVGLEALFRCVEARLNRAQINGSAEDYMLAKLRSSLHSNLPHEFFTPLGGIIGFADILRSSFATLAPDEVEEMLNDIHLSGLRLHRTIRNYLMVLDLQVTSQKTVPWIKYLMPDELETSIRSGVEAVVQRNGRTQDVTIQCEACSALVSPNDIGLIVEELVDNACKYSLPGTPVTLHLNANGVLTITDHGRGMSAENIEQIKVFRQFDRKKQEQQGLGLGLVLIKHLTKKYGAHFTIESQVSKGTQVQITFKIK